MTPNEGSRVQKLSYFLPPQLLAHRHAFAPYFPRDGSTLHHEPQVTDASQGSFED